MLEWIDSVKNRTRLSETQLSMIYSMKCENKSLRMISASTGIDRGAVQRLFMTQDQIKSKRKAWNKQYHQRMADAEKRKRMTASRTMSLEKFKKDTVRVRDAYANKNNRSNLMRSLRDSVLSQPTERLKMIWDRQGVWARKYSVCIECNSDFFKHHSLGLCCKCKQKLKVIPPDKIAQYNKNRRDNGRNKAYAKLRRDEMIGVYKKAKSGEIVLDERGEEIIRKIEETYKKKL